MEEISDTLDAKLCNNMLFNHVIHCDRFTNNLISCSQHIGYHKKCWRKMCWKFPLHFLFNAWVWLAYSQDKEVDILVFQLSLLPCS